MRTNYGLAVMAFAATTAAAWSQILVQGINQHVEIGTLRTLVVARFFDSSADPTARLAARIIGDLLDRSPTPEEILFERDRLRYSMPLDAFVREKLHTAEHLGLVVDGYFVRILERLPDPSERGYFTWFLSEGRRESDLVVELFTSRAYLSPLLELDPQAWLDDLFTRLTGRAPSAVESSGLMMLYSMNFNYQATVQVIANSDPVRTALIIEAYRNLLLRDPTATEIATHLNEFSAGMTETDFRTRLLTSPEYADLDVAPVYVASVDWGDGSKSDGIIELNIDGGYVVAEHTYAAIGTFNAVTTVMDQSAHSGAGAAPIEVHPPADPGDLEIFSVVAGYLDGPAPTGLQPGETTGAGEGAYAEDPNTALVDGLVVAGETDASGETETPNGEIVVATCGFGAPAALGVLPLVAALRRHRRSPR